MTRARSTCRPANASSGRKSGWRYALLTKVDQQCLYLGQLPGNFYYVQKRGSKVFISCHVWCLRPEHLAWEPTLNPE